jgi:hypothetical protein
VSADLSPALLADLARVYATLQPQALPAAFLSDLKQVYGTLPAASEANLQFLAKRFGEWRSRTQGFVHTRLAQVSDDDPLKCSISLFRTMDAGRLETAHTRTLAWLLDPKAEHGFGITLIVALLRHLSGEDWSAGLRVERVQSEYLIGGSSAKGRLDVLAEGAWEDGQRNGWVLVIEAKVDAGEGEGQLPKYAKWLRANAAGRECICVFLTPDGRAPDTSETDAEEWEALSYLELVRVFRDVYGGLRRAPGFHFLRFYLAGVLQDVCHWPRNIGDGSADVYAVAAYLKAVRDSNSERAGHDSTR